MNWRERIHVLGDVVAVMKSMSRIPTWGGCDVGCEARINHEIANLASICGKLCDETRHDIVKANAETIVSGVADALYPRSAPDQSKSAS